MLNREELINELTEVVNTLDGEVLAKMYKEYVGESYLEDMEHALAEFEDASYTPERLLSMGGLGFNPHHKWAYCADGDGWYSSDNVLDLVSFDDLIVNIVDTDYDYNIGEIRDVLNRGKEPEKKAIDPDELKNLVNTLLLSQMETLVQTITTSVVESLKKGE